MTSEMRSGIEIGNAAMLVVVVVVVVVPVHVVVVFQNGKAR